MSGSAALRHAADGEALLPAVATRELERLGEVVDLLRTAAG
ncbi:hypothetical protein [Nocardiopsis sp. CNR-923]|nr:hypothetical protein [Nocardiopsis sp. CNR-923]